MTANFLPLDRRHYPPVGYRVIHDGNGRRMSPSAGFDIDGNLISRDPCSNTISALMFDDHLSWGTRRTPFVSFFSRWDQAVRRREWLIDQGCQNLEIVAFDTANIPTIFDAYEVAQQLGYPYMSRDRRRNLQYHQHEFLALGWIDEGAIYTRFA